MRPKATVRRMLEEASFHALQMNRVTCRIERQLYNEARAYRLFKREACDILCFGEVGFFPEHDSKSIPLIKVQEPRPKKQAGNFSGSRRAPI